MKKICSILLFTMIGLSACTKKGTSTSSSLGTMTATAAGTTFTATRCYESSGGAYYSITGDNGTNVIGINIKSNNITTGTYNFDSTGLNNAASYTINGSTTKIAKSGSVTITAINVGVSFIGTFNFICTDGTSVVNGAFTAVI